MKKFEFKKIEVYSESELSLFIKRVEADIEYQQAVVTALETQLAFLKSDRVEREKILKERQKYEIFLRCKANAERIEKRLSLFFEKNWHRFQFLFSKPIKPYDAELIHHKISASHVSFPRSIMVYFIEQLSGLNHSQVASYFNLTNNASPFNYAKKIVENAMVYPEFRILFEEMRECTRILIPKMGHGKQIKYKKLTA